MAPGRIARVPHAPLLSVQRIAASDERRGTARRLRVGDHIMAEPVPVPHVRRALRMQLQRCARLSSSSSSCSTSSSSPFPTGPAAAAAGAPAATGEAQGGEGLGGGAEREALLRALAEAPADAFAATMGGGTERMLVHHAARLAQDTEVLRLVCERTADVVMSGAADDDGVDAEGGDVERARKVRETLLSAVGTGDTALMLLGENRHLTPDMLAWVLEHGVVTDEHLLSRNESAGTTFLHRLAVTLTGRNGALSAEQDAALGDVLMAVVERVPEALTVKDANGRTPRATLSEEGRGKAVLRRIAGTGAAPEGVQPSDDDAAAPPSMPPGANAMMAAAAAMFGLNPATMASAAAAAMASASSTPSPSSQSDSQPPLMQAPQEQEREDGQGKVERKEQSDQPRPLSEWSVDELCEQLAQSGLEDYVAVFQRERVDGIVFSALEEPELQELLGVDNRLHRLRMISLRTKFS